MSSIEVIVRISNVQTLPEVLYQIHRDTCSYTFYCAHAAIQVQLNLQPRSLAETDSPVSGDTVLLNPRRVVQDEHTKTE